MITLDDITVSQFIDILCGNAEALGDGVQDPQAVARDLVAQYRQIADPAGLKSYLSESEGVSKARCNVVLYTICEILCDLERFENVREVLMEAGVRTSNMKDSMVRATVRARLEKARNDLKRKEKEEEETEKREVDVRRDFDEQTAALMAHFRFQIELTTMKATLYAHLVARFQREIKAREAALRR